MSSMKGKMITEKQQSMINAIQEQLDVHFFGADRHDACAFIGEWIEKLPPRKEMPIIDKMEYGECFVCQDPLKESFNFMDMVHKESICEECYVIRQHDKDWQHAIASLGTPKPKAKPKKTKAKPLDEPKKKRELPYTICTSCNSPIFTLEDWVSASPDTCHACHEKSVTIPEPDDSYLPFEMGSSMAKGHIATPSVKRSLADVIDNNDHYLQCRCCRETTLYSASFIDLISHERLCYTCYGILKETDEWKIKAGRKTSKDLEEIELHSKEVSFDKLDLLTQPTKPKKRGNNMFNNIKSIMGDFGKITTGDFKLAFQGIAIRTTKSDKYSDGTDAYAVYDADNNRMLDVMDFVLDVDNVLYKMPVALNTLKQGDIILVKDKPLVVKSVNVEAQSVRALNPISNNETTHKPAGNLFGFNFITKVTSMFDMMQPTGEQAGFNPMMLMALNGDKGEGMEGLLPLMMMGGLQGGATANPMQQMLPLMMMSDKSGDGGDMMQMMMMSQMFNGQQGGANPFGAMFGQAPVAPAPVVPTPADVTDVEAVVDRIIAKLEKRLTPATDDSSQDTESK